MTQTKQQKGMVAEAVFLAWAFLSRFAQVCRPLEANLPYDFMMFDLESGVWMKVQVKSAYRRKQRGGISYVGLRRGRGGAALAYIDGDFDYLFVYDDITQDKYLVPWAIVAHIKSSIALSAIAKYRLPNGMA